jgi:hypothetical protein
MLGKNRAAAGRGQARERTRWGCERKFVWSMTADDKKYFDSFLFQLPASSKRIRRE